MNFKWPDSLVRHLLLLALSPLELLALLEPQGAVVAGGHFEEVSVSALLDDAAVAENEYFVAMLHS